MADTGVLQAAERIATQNQGVVASLQNSREADLLAALAQRVQDAAEGSPGIARMTAIDPDRLPRDSATIALGRRIVARWSRTMHEFLCGGGGEEEEDLRRRLMAALTGRDGGAPALLAGTLVAAFGASPAVAALVAALLMKLVIAPAKDELCRSWAASLDPPAAGAA
jgi:hypothetical protein